MNFKYLVAASSLITVLATTPLQAGGPGGKGGTNHSPGPNYTVQTSAPLTGTEADHLLFMREEEKLARDVYLTLYDQWQHSVFSNISSAEQRHMDALAVKIDTYGLVDPVVDDTVGVFTNTDLSILFEDLTAKGESSLLDALYVGAFIEEIDILDLQEAIATSTHPDLIRVYENLMRGSRNHLRAFVRQIENLGVPYEAQEMDQSEVDMILDQPLERGRPVRNRRQGR